MTKALTVLVDMDEVLALYDSEVIKRLKKLHSHIPIIGERTNFYIAEDYGEHAQLLRDIADEAGFFESLPVGIDALAGWQRLIDYGYHPRICSSPKLTNPYSKEEKLRWLRRHFVPHFGEWVADEAIITRDKHLYDGIALIDDRPEVKSADEAPWQHIIFDQPYNQHVDTPRLRGWLDDSLPELLEAATKEYAKRESTK